MTKLALCVGINNYPGTDSDLAGCVNDAQDWVAVAQARGFETMTCWTERPPAPPF